MSDQTERELKELQQRIDMRREQLAKEESDLQPVAVSVEGGPLRYAELDLTMPEPDITSFGQQREHVAPLGDWRMDVDGFVNPSTSSVAVRFGDTRTQPYEGKAFVTMVETQPIDGGYVSILKSTGPLVYRREVGT